MGAASSGHSPFAACCSLSNAETDKSFRSNSPSNSPNGSTICLGASKHDSQRGISHLLEAEQRGKALVDNAQRRKKQITEEARENAFVEAECFEASFKDKLKRQEAQIEVETSKFDESIARSFDNQLMEDLTHSNSNKDELIDLLYDRVINVMLDLTANQRRVLQANYRQQSEEAEERKITGASPLFVAKVPEISLQEPRQSTEHQLPQSGRKSGNKETGPAPPQSGSQTDVPLATKMPKSSGKRKKGKEAHSCSDADEGVICNGDDGNYEKGTVCSDEEDTVVTTSERLHGHNSNPKVNKKPGKCDKSPHKVQNLRAKVDKE